jgi:hypothetical protein
MLGRGCHAAGADADKTDWRVGAHAAGELHLILQRARDYADPRAVILTCENEAKFAAMMSSLPKKGAIFLHTSIIRTLG